MGYKWYIDSMLVYTLWESNVARQKILYQWRFSLLGKSSNSLAFVLFAEDVLYRLIRCFAN
jgi:hypothetical protein